MRREVSGWIVAGIVTVLACTLGAMQQESSATGRYQVANGVCETIRKDGTRDSVSVVLLVDTATGQTRAMYAPEGANIRWSGFLGVGYLGLEEK